MHDLCHPCTHSQNINPKKMKGFIMNNEQMVLSLVQYELKYLLDNPDNLDDVAIFFANGGFNYLTLEQLKEKYKDNCWLE